MSQWSIGVGVEEGGVTEMQLTQCSGYMDMFLFFRKDPDWQWVRYIDSVSEGKCAASLLAFVP